jgi:hypothetical protein
MNYSKRAGLFGQLRTKYAGFLASVLWKLNAKKSGAYCREKEI